MDFEKLARPFLKNVQPYKAGKPIEAAQRERRTKEGFIKLASNENPYPPQEDIQKAVIDMLSQVNRYPESGSFELVMELAKKHSVSPEEVFVGNGSNEIIDLLVRAFAFPDENLVYPWPSFVVYRLVSTICGLESTEVPCMDNKVDLDGIRWAVNDKTKLVFICNPNNPTSTYVTRQEFSDFLESLPEEILVVMDEAYYEYVTAEDYPQTLEMRKNRSSLVTLRTFSKVHSLAGIRIGYAVADPQVVEILHKVRQPFNVNRLAQAAALAALKCQKEIQPIVDQTIKERESLRKAILKIGWECPPSQTNFLYIIPKGFSGDVCEPLLEKGIIARNMAQFGGEADSFRLTVGTPEENRKFLEALDAVLAARS
ncbi:MAG: histidinol-phosphate transaminase [Candidatus Latescibacteria bacterium]|nr:histidinol-phosphate transaminase [Candidatus Latescibacterota bacterium]NIM21332.1 histidinol-phosphate transaminase [Candidatus Latescibacterota bacterium]NIM65513.1 histidinol-phosphate transaminase [Candidatus Latescibacterota bacterium]NIO01893.1 histidinol-phosphate transaminase [Candidatus Latescibacterota bacterium]NIO28706.1 histidinol-phosphate transaminase [Candidatus Latescibacterota bacterium]